MNPYLVRVGMSKKLYPEIAHIFSIGHYKPKELGEDDFSRELIYFYKFGNKLNFFLERLIDMFKLRFEGDTIKFDYITLYPTRKKNEINPNMNDLIKKFSQSVNLPYNQILRRNRDIKPNHELRTFEERKDNVYKGRESDWSDLNKTLKYSRIIGICKTPYVSEEKRRKWKKEQ